ncbi:MAG: hypothetical protein H6935_16375 [Thiobacillus sp.]|nr:hypothetical protein [Thiobacillus sp.]
MIFDMIVNKPSQGKYPFSPFIEVALKLWHVGKSNQHSISPYLCTWSEVDAFIDALICELERIRRAAKKVLPG